MARLPYVDLSTAPPAVRDVLEAVPPLKLFQMMAQAETAFPPLMEFAAVLLTGLKLDVRLRELGILRAAQLTGAEYVWQQHVVISRGLGVAPEQVQALKRGEIREPTFSQVEILVVNFTTEVVRQVGASEATVEALKAHLSAQEIVELLLTIGYYVMLAQLILSTAIENDVTMGMGVVDAARDRQTR